MTTSVIKTYAAQRVLRNASYRICDGRDRNVNLPIVAAITRAVTTTAAIAATTVGTATAATAVGVTSTVRHA